MRSPTISHYWMCQAGLSGLYLFGAWIANRFVTLPDELVLIWPPAGLTFGILLLFGVRWWPFIPIGVLLNHLIFAPVPWPFLPFSMGSNTVGTVLAVFLLQRLARSSELVAFTTRSGFLMLTGGLIQATIGALIGTAGLLLAGMISAELLWSSAFRWLLADLFGLIVVGPFVLSLVRARQRGGPPGSLSYPGRLEHFGLLTGLLLSLSGQWALSASAPNNALVLSFLPAAVLMWSALRMSPLVTTGLTLIAGLVIAGFANFGIGGFVAPGSAADIAVLLIFLSVLVVFPLTVAASHHESRIAAAEILKRAMTDRLTGLPNRAAFEANASREIDSDPRLPLALAYIDVDQFKLVNDTLGHAVGDQFVRGLAGVLAHLLRPQDTLARIGGDEFAVLLHQCDAPAAAAWAQLAITAIEKFRYGHQDSVLSVTASIGLVPLSHRGPSFSEVFARADAACFAAKELGGNRLQSSAFSDTGMADREEAMRWAMRLNTAVENNQFELYFQRIVPLTMASNLPDKLEVLLRLRDDDGGLMLPGRFIPAVERFSLSARLDRHVFERTLSWFEAHRLHSPRALSIAINLSAASLADESLAAYIEQRLGNSSLPAQAICFEITETGAVRDLNLARNFIVRMRNLGCSVALDDFGAGYCSFAYLRHLPVDILKIDGSFVRDLPDSELAVAVVRSMAQIARTLSMRTVAECVESEAVRNCLIELGVDYAQGFALHVPEPLEFLLRIPAETARRVP